ncbi:MAG: STM4012 family radical SAM protein [Spirochaetota bacterium]
MSLQSSIKNNYFQSYAYSYPHKSAYRLLEKPRNLQDVWNEESKKNLFLYLHIPFCETRCGFCNLFTLANPNTKLQESFLDTLTRQVTSVQESLGKASFAEMAIGGGTPTFLTTKEIQGIFSLLKGSMQVNLTKMYSSIEASPATLSEEKLALLKEQGITRVSIGVQSFLAAETKALGRPQNLQVVHQALEQIKNSGIPELNIDLIYGMDAQTKESWLYSLQQCLNYLPEEVFLYPLYVRPLTGLGLRAKDWNDHRLHLYRQGRDFLLQNGYEQISMRLFRRNNAPIPVTSAYNRCEDGMLGLGVGARSYTQSFHYSSEYAVSRKGSKGVIQDYVENNSLDFAKVYYGVDLSTDEQRRRYVIKSLLEGRFLDLDAYETFFGSKVFADLPQLYELYDMQLLIENNNILRLNQKGLELSDVIGPWLYSPQIKDLMEKFALV